jgi:hypothetical protein
MMILSLYCRNISLFSKRTPYVTLKAIPLLFLENDNPLYFYCSLKREKIIFWPLPLIPPKDYCIHSFWSQNTEKRNNTISQMRLQSRWDMVLFLFSSVFSNESNSNSKRFSDLFIVGNGNFLSGIGMFTIDFNCSRFGFIRGCIFGSFFCRF